MNSYEERKAVQAELLNPPLGVPVVVVLAVLLAGAVFTVSLAWVTISAGWNASTPAVQLTGGKTEKQ